MRKRILNFEENLQASVNVESLKPETILKLCLNETAQLRTVIGILPVGNKVGLCGTLDVQFDMEQSGRLLVGTGMRISTENAPDISLKETRILNDEIVAADKVKYCGNIGTVSDKCGTGMVKTIGMET